VDTARAFLGSMSAPQTSVGIFCDDLANAFGLPCPGTLPGTQLVSLTALGRTCLNFTDTASQALPCNFVTVANKDVRFIVNAGTAQSVFGTPFGNAPRNIAQDAITNVANLSVFKNVKFSEHSSFQFRASAQNVFNHPNFTSVDPFVDDAGQFGSFTGFGDPRTTGTAYPGFNGGTRRFSVGGTFQF
jgi:hypothetical protein